MRNHLHLVLMESFCFFETIFVSILSTLVILFLILSTLAIMTTFSDRRPSPPLSLTVVSAVIVVVFCEDGVVVAISGADIVVVICSAVCSCRLLDLRKESIELLA